MYGASETVKGCTPPRALESYFGRDKGKTQADPAFLKTGQAGKIGFKEGVDKCSNPAGRFPEEQGAKIEFNVTKNG